MRQATAICAHRSDVSRTHQTGVLLMVRGVRSGPSRVNSLVAFVGYLPALLHLQFAEPTAAERVVGVGRHVAVGHGLSAQLNAHLALSALVARACKHVAPRLSPGSWVPLRWVTDRNLDGYQDWCNWDVNVTTLIAQQATALFFTCGAELKISWSEFSKNAYIMKLKQTLLQNIST